MHPSPITQLPAEVLAHIFEARLEMARDDGRAMLQLARVCKHWKQVAFHHPQLWASLSLNYYFGAPMMTTKLVRHLELWFIRAGSLPLSLDITFHPIPEPMFFTYLVNCPKWERLRFCDAEGKLAWMNVLLEAMRMKCETNDGRPCWPSLGSLQIHSSTYKGAEQTFARGVVERIHYMAPSLQDLGFLMPSGMSDAPTIILDFIQFSWPNLTRLTLYGIERVQDPEFIYLTLLRAHNLEALSLWGASSQGFSAPNAWPMIDTGLSLPIIHQRLRHVVFDLPEDLLESIMTNVELPRMRSLKLIVNHPGCASATSVLAPRWFFPLLRHVSRANPSFWPRLQEFAFGSVYSPYTLRKGDADFDAFRRNPAAWLRKRDKSTTGRVRIGHR